MRRPDQRQRSSLGKTFGQRMDGIYVRKIFPLGLLVLGPRDQVTNQKWQHKKGGNANPHTYMGLSVQPPPTLPLLLPIMHLFCSSPSKLWTTQYLCPLKLHQPNSPYPPTHFHAPPPHPPPQPFTPKTLKLHHRGLTGNPDTTHC